MSAPVGTIYAEIGIDYTPATRAQQQLLKDAQGVSLNIEQNFKNLGIKSTAEFDLMRQKITNSFDMIRNSSKATADDILRAEKAKNEQITRINEQQFGKQTSIISDLKTHWIAASAVIYAAYAGISKAWDMAKVGAEYSEQRGILDNLAAKYDTTADQIVEAMQRASEFQIAKVDLMSISLAGLGKGLKPEQLLNLADAAKILGDVAGKDATTALRDLTEALETGRTKGLKTYLGTSLDLTSAFGELESKMTATEKAQAMYAVTMKAASELQAQQTKDVNKTADQMEQMEAAYKDAMLAASNFFKTIVGGAYNIATSNYIPTMDKIIEKLYEMAGGKLKKVEVDNEAVKAEKDEAEATKALVAPYEKIIDSLKKQLQARKDKEEADKKGIATTKKSAEEEQRILDNQVKQKTDYLEKVKDEQQDFWTWKNKEEEDAAEKATKLLEKQTKEAEDAARDRIKIERDLYKDLRGYELQGYNASITLIRSQAEEYRKKGVNQTVIDAWVTQETTNAYIKMGKASKSFTDGATAAYLELQRDAVTWGQVSYDTVKGFASSASNVLGTVFFDFAKGQLGSFSDYWTSFTDSLRRTFMNVLAEMTVQWAMLQGAMAMGVMVPGIGTGLAAGAGGAAFSSGAAAGMAGSSIFASGASLSSAVMAGEIYSVPGGFIVGGVGDTAAFMTASDMAMAAAPWLAGGLLADQLLFGGKGTQFLGDVVGGAADLVGDIVGGIGDVFGFAKGGIVGEGGDFKRVNPLAFAGAPRAAMGLKVDEVPIIAHRGERVLNPQETREYESGPRVLHIHLETNREEWGNVLIDLMESSGRVRKSLQRAVRN